MTKICKSFTCSNVVAKGRRVCERCKSKINRLKNPASTSFQQLRCNARKRGIAFTLTLEEWKKFCEETNYLNLRGVLPEQCCVDRKDATKGYNYDNLQLLTNSENGRKAVVVDKPALKKVRAHFVWTDNPFYL